MTDLLHKLQRLYESSIDFAREDLDPVVWIKLDQGVYAINPGAERRIVDVLDAYPYFDLRAAAADLRIVGSITTNQYVDDSDVDVHIVPRNVEEWDEEKSKEVTRWFNENRDRISGRIGQHPIEVYIQTNPYQDLMSDGVYDIFRKTWIKGPKIVSLDYDPYEDFSHIADDLRSTVEDADLLLGELKRDVIDYDVIKTAIEKLPSEQKQRFLSRLESKLQEIEDDIEQLYGVRKDLIQTRRVTSAPTSPEQALQDVELAKKWKDSNALFKFVGRYQYLKIIGELKKLLDDDSISDKDVDRIRKIAGVSDG